MANLKDIKHKTEKQNSEYVLKKPKIDIEYYLKKI